jgi:Flp pilus assembly protein CpaB
MAGAVMPGDLIDIYGTYNEGGVAKAFQFLPAVTVIARVGTSLVLSVKPEEALLLSVAKNTCQLTFTLRSKKETAKDLELAPVSAHDILPRAKQLSTERIQRGPRITDVDK